MFVFTNSSLTKFKILNNIFYDLKIENIVLSSEEKYQVLFNLELKTDKLKINQKFFQRKKGQSAGYKFLIIKEFFILKSYNHLLEFISEEVFKKFTFYPRTLKDNYNFLRKFREELFMFEKKLNFYNNLKILISNNTILNSWLLKNIPILKYEIINIFFYGIKTYLSKNSKSLKVNKCYKQFFYLLLNFMINGINSKTMNIITIRKKEEKKTHRSLLLIKNKNDIYLLSSNKLLQKKLLSKINILLKVRGITYNNKHTNKLNSIKQKINIGTYQLVKHQDDNLICIPSKDNIKQYKNKLKMIVKNNKITSLISNLNKELNKWKKDNFFLENFQSLGKELDNYVNKILWRYVKRLHSRRSNMWIYKKYWKYLFGNWRFFYINNITGKIDILISHRFFLRLNTLNRIPLITNVFKLINSKKVFYINFLNIKINIGGITRVIYNKQKGLCFKCKLPLCFNEIKICKIKNKFFILIHTTCKF